MEREKEGELFRFSCCVKVSEMNVQSKKGLLWLSISEFQFKVSWLHVFGSVIKQGFSGIEICDKGICTSHFKEEGGVRRYRGQNVPFQGTYTLLVTPLLH